MILPVIFLYLCYVTSGHHLGEHMLAVNSPQVQSLVASNNDFAVTLYKQLANSQNASSMISSPFSVSTAIGMLYAGAKGRTEAEINTAIGFSQTGLSKDNINSAYHTLLTEQRGHHEGYDLNLANSVWIKQGLAVLQDFKDTLKDIYFAEEREVEFDTPATTNSINSWVSKETQGKIPQLFDETLDANTAMVLINAIYFKGTWKTKFPINDTQNTNFKNEDDAQKSKAVPMMRVESKYGYGESRELEAQLLELPYKGEEMSMIVVLPREGSTLTGLHQKLTSELLETAIEGITKNQKVNVILPKFKTESTFSLKEALTSFGMESAFTSQANLTGISPDEKLKVSKVLQKALIEVNEEGSEAAAATSVEVVFYSLPRYEPDELHYFHATHPFIYLIRHNPSKTTLFMGNINQL